MVTRVSLSAVKSRYPTDVVTLASLSAAKFLLIPVKW
jgi:hypothetical protein